MVRSQFDDPPPPRRVAEPRAEYRPRNPSEDTTQNRNLSFYGSPGVSTQYSQQISNQSYSPYKDYGQQQAFSSFPFQQPQPFAMVNPIGSIVGLRVVQLDTGLGYIPVEPHINYLINQQFGRGGPVYTTPPHVPVNYAVTPQTLTASSTPPADPGPHQHQRAQSQDPPKRQAKEIDDDWFKPNPQPKSGVRRSANWKNEAGSLANLSISQAHSTVLTRQTMDQPLSSQELHKLELMKQIEENKRRKEIERQKELDFERNEMRKLEEYNVKIRREEEEERRKEKDRAAAMERRAAAIAAEQDARARQLRRRASPPPVENIQPPRGRRGSTTTKQPEMDEEELQPRLEWWERKPNHEDPRRSAVIPTMREENKNRPASRSRHAYSPADSIRQHQSRGQSRDQRRVEPAARIVSSKPRRASIPPQRAPNLDDERPIRPAASNTNSPFDDSMAT